MNRYAAGVFFVVLSLLGTHFLDQAVAREPSRMLYQNIRESLFGEVDKIRAEAEAQLAQILSPRNYEKAMENYNRADRDFEKGKNLEDIREKVNRAIRYFEKALENIELARVTFVTTLNAREDAQKADAPTFALDLWEKAEKALKSAAEELEKGDVKDARRKSAEAETLYREAELEAIKMNYLADTWELLKQAEEEDVEEYAPKTFRKAQELALEAEKELMENRYDTDRPRSLAQQAQYEARHALYLAHTIRQIKKTKTELEDLILISEEPLRRIAAALDVFAEFDKGIGKVGDQILASVNSLQDSLVRLKQDLEERRSEIANLEARIKELEDQLGDIAQEKTVLAQRIEAQAKIRQQFVQVEKLFSRNEAQVLREGNNVIIRLVGLNFPVGQAIIQPRYFALLRKVQQAISIFPECSVTIEGHTDSHGSDRLNLRLSQQRAEAVKAYLLANMDLPESRVKAVGYGESRPIANNETPEGRAKNRRIDVVIHPHLPGLEASNLGIHQADEKRP